MPSVDLHRASPVRQVLTEPVPLSLQTLLGLSLASSLPRSLSLSLSLILYCSLARLFVRSLSLSLVLSDLPPLVPLSLLLRQTPLSSTAVGLLSPARSFSPFSSSALTPVESIAVAMTTVMEIQDQEGAFSTGG